MTAQPLSGRTILSCRQADRSEALSDLLRDQGATVVDLPLIEVVPPPDGGVALADALGRLDEFDWLACTSVNGVESLAGVELPAGLRIAAVGPTTADAFERIVGRNALIVPTRQTAADLALAFPPRPGTVLAPLAELANNDLADGLRNRGFTVEVVIAYSTITPDHPAELLDRAAAVDAVVISSPSIARRLIDVLGDRAPSQAVTTGPRSQSVAIELGFGPVEATPDTIVEGLLKLF